MCWPWVSISWQNFCSFSLNNEQLQYEDHTALCNQVSKDHIYESFNLRKTDRTIPVLVSAPAKENIPVPRLSLAFAFIIHAIAKIPIFKVIHTELVMDLQILFHFARSCILRAAGVHFIKVKQQFWHLKCQNVGILKASFLALNASFWHSKCQFKQYKCNILVF